MIAVTFPIRAALSFLVILELAASPPVKADTVVAARTIRARTVLSAQDFALRPGTIPGAAHSIEPLVGMEARVALYAGRPVREGDVGPPALIERNQLVALVYTGGGLRIQTEGRALDRAGAGDIARVMNLSSRATVTGMVRNDGSVVVSPQEDR